MTPGDALRKIVAHAHDCSHVEDCSLINQELGFDQWDEIATEFLDTMLPRMRLEIEEDPY